MGLKRHICGCDSFLQSIQDLPVNHDTAGYPDFDVVHTVTPHGYGLCDRHDSRFHDLEVVVAWTHRREKETPILTVHRRHRTRFNAPGALENIRLAAEDQGLHEAAALRLDVHDPA